MKANLGCGSRVLSGWLNVDFPGNKMPQVVQMDLCRAWPFSTSSLAAIYSSHFLEHLPAQEAKQLIKKCYVSLKRGGVFRVCVPDLEYNAKLYLKSLNQIRKHPKKICQLIWARYNLFEQMVRNEPGGLMAQFLKQSEPSALRFVANTTGGPEAYQPNLNQKSKKPRTLKTFWSKVFHYREKSVSPEKHRWAYDEFELSQILRDIGFVKIQRKPAGKSLIRGWKEPGIEIHKDGKEWKPNSLILEAMKP